MTHERTYTVSGLPHYEGLSNNYPCFSIPAISTQGPIDLGESTIVNTTTNESVQVFGVQCDQSVKFLLWGLDKADQFEVDGVKERLARVVQPGSEIKVVSTGSVEHSAFKKFPKETAVLISDMSGFTSNVRKFGIVHVASLIIKQRQVLKPIWKAYGATDIWYEADNNWVLFPNTKSAMSAALEAVKILKEYNAAISKESHKLTVAGFGIDSGDEVLKDKEEGKIFGPSVDTAFYLAEDVASDLNILISERAFDSIKTDPQFTKLNATHAEEKGVKHYVVNGHLENPVCHLTSFNYGTSPLDVMCKRATFPEQVETIDAEITAKYMTPKTAMFFGVDSDVVKSLGLQKWFEIREQIDSLMKAVFNSFHGAQRVIFNFWLFEKAGDALKAVLIAKKAIKTHNALVSNAPWPVKGFGIHTGPMLTIPDTDICFGDAANTASKVSEDAGENLSVFCSKASLKEAGEIPGLTAQPKTISVSGVELECFALDF